jgi:DNA-binding NtrC family response regulator
MYLVKNNNLSVRTLLIVDDEEMLRDILVEQLQCLGVHIETAPDGQAALEILRSQTIEAVLCDISMPQMTGLELFQAVNMLDLHTPFVFLTAYDDKRSLMKALRLGAMDFILKPFDSKELISVVERALEIGYRWNRIQELRTNPGNEQELQKAERMVSLFKLFNDSKRNKAS